MAGFDKKSAERIARVVRNAERQFRGDGVVKPWVQERYEHHIGMALDDIKAPEIDAINGDWEVFSGRVEVWKWFNDTDTDSRTEIEATTKTFDDVFSISETDIPQDCFVHVLREPISGQWFCFRVQHLIRFELTAPLDLDGTATAKRVRYNDSSFETVGENFNVIASLSGIWGPAPVGASGWCVKTERGYEIVFMQRAALFVCATTTTDFVSGEATATVDDSWRGLAPESSIQVVLCAGIYDSECPPKVGSKVVAAFDESTNKYNVIEITLNKEADEEQSISTQLLTDISLCWDGADLQVRKNYSTLSIDINSCGDVVAAALSGQTQTCSIVDDCDSPCGSGGDDNGSGSGGGPFNPGVGDDCEDCAGTTPDTVRMFFDFPMEDGRCGECDQTEFEPYYDLPQTSPCSWGGQINDMCGESGFNFSLSVSLVEDGSGKYIYAGVSHVGAVVVGCNAGPNATFRKNYTGTFSCSGYHELTNQEIDDSATNTNYPYNFQDMTLAVHFG